MTLIWCKLNVIHIDLHIHQFQYEYYLHIFTQLPLDEIAVQTDLIILLYSILIKSWIIFDSNWYQLILSAGASSEVLEFQLESSLIYLSLVRISIKLIQSELWNFSIKHIFNVCLQIWLSSLTVIKVRIELSNCNSY